MLLRSSWVGSPCADLPLPGGSDLFFVTVTVAVAVADAARAAAAAARGLRLHRIDGRTIGFSLDDAGDQCRSRAAGHRGSVSGPVLSTCGWPQRHWQATSAEHVRLATEALAGYQCRVRAACHRGTGRRRGCSCCRHACAGGEGRCPPMQVSRAMGGEAEELS